MHTCLAYECTCNSNNAIITFGFKLPTNWKWKLNSRYWNKHLSGYFAQKGCMEWYRPCFVKRTDLIWRILSFRDKNIFCRNAGKNCSFRSFTLKIWSREGFNFLFPDQRTLHRLKFFCVEKKGKFILTGTSRGTMLAWNYQGIITIKNTFINILIIILA